MVIHRSTHPFPLGCDPAGNWDELGHTIGPLAKVIDSAAGNRMVEESLNSALEMVSRSSSGKFQSNSARRTHFVEMKHSPKVCVPTSVRLLE